MMRRGSKRPPPLPDCPPGFYSVCPRATRGGEGSFGSPRGSSRSLSCGILPDLFSSGGWCRKADPRPSASENCETDTRGKSPPAGESPRPSGACCLSMRRGSRPEQVSREKRERPEDKEGTGIELCFLFSDVSRFSLPPRFFPGALRCFASMTEEKANCSIKREWFVGFCPRRRKNKNLFCLAAKEVIWWITTAKRYLFKAGTANDTDSALLFFA